MTLRFVRTREIYPDLRDDGRDEDWLLYSGHWQIGSIGRPGGNHRASIAWSLTGPATPQAPVQKSGLEADVAAAKKHLEESFRAWAGWAGILPEGSARWLLTTAYASELAPSSDPANDRLLASGAYRVGRVHRPRSGPRHDPHWKLWVLGAASPGSFAQQGFAATDAEAQARLIGGWSDFLAWAELPGIPARSPAA